jgi:hypothetical protein
MKKAENHIIVAVHVTNRVRHAAAIQAVLTSYGVNIKTRIGLHEANGRASSPSGVILLEMVGGEKKCCGIVAKLNAIPGVEAKKVVFEH